jgi:hypothetical protein
MEKEICTGCNQPQYIQNKKYKMCNGCIFEKNHGGKSKAEVYTERASKKKGVQTVVKLNGKVVGSIGRVVVQDEESLKNEINQNAAEEREKGEQGFPILGYKTSLQGREILKKKQKPIKQVSAKQSLIERAYKLTIKDMDYTTEKVCSGCNKYQGGDIKLSHSHIISRADCKGIGKPELIYERENLTYHCMDFGMNKGCHGLWENPVMRKLLFDYEKNINYIKSVSEEMYLKYKAA